MMPKRDFLSFLFAVAIGAGIWALSPIVTGETEPWDSRGPYYSIALLAGGALSAAVCPQYFWLAPIGIQIGVLAFMLLKGIIGPFIILFPLFALYHMIPSFIGAVAVYGIYGAARSESRSGER
ncbi:hypothetical protein [Schlesneria sp. T3-172]|uniref:hypothetical protein n=1 Tax=Schlesneria sphaerica TaxID=3373610 RepID=UPI0037CBDB46